MVVRIGNERIMVSTRRENRRDPEGDSRSRRTKASDSPAPAETFRRGFAALTELAISGVQVTASAIEIGSGEVLFSVDDHLPVPTAALGEIMLLIEVAARQSSGDASAEAILNRTAADTVGGSGIWQHLQVPALPTSDLAALVGATSDNLATNVLLRQVGLDSVRARGESLGLRRTLLLDMVRDRRGPDDAPQLSVGSARELADLLARLASGEIVDEETSQQVLDWLSFNSDLSMVASAFGLDPHAHQSTDHGLLLVNTTGTARGVRAEAGVLSGPRVAVAYAVTMRFNDSNLSARLAVLEGMRTFGTDVLEHVF